MNYKLEKIYNKHVKEIPYEGKEIDKENLVAEIYNQAIQDILDADDYIFIDDKDRREIEKLKMI